MVASVLASLGRLQPVVVAGGTAYIRASAPAATPTPLTLKTARGVVHQLRRLGELDALAGRHNRLILAELWRRVAAEAATLGAGQSVDDQLDDFLLFAGAWAGHDLEPSTSAAELREEVDTRLLTLPGPELQEPCLLLAGRAWRLASTPRPSPGWLHVTVADGPALRPSGESLPLATVEADWRGRVDDVVRRAASQLVSRTRRCSPADLAAARIELEQSGAVRRGALLFLGGDPPTLGHLVPGGYTDNSLRRASTGQNIAVGHPWREPPELGWLQAFCRGRSGWRQEPLRHGVCLGAGPAALDQGPLALPAFLRWCANRIHTNGAWHEADLR
jgi:hypothetical protein